MKRAIPRLLAVLVALGCLASCNRKSSSSETVAKNDDSLARVKRAGVILWGADVVGGVPYVYEDPNHPGIYIGFEKDIADAIGRHLGIEVRLVVKAWDTLIPELQRGSFDFAMNGIENTPDRGKIVLFSEPYFVYSQKITVRAETAGVEDLDDLKGKKVATLSGTAAEDILRATPGIQVVTNPEIIYSYRDLEEGKVDAVLIDTPIAAAYGGESNSKLKNVGGSFGEGRYVIAFRNEDTSLQSAVNSALQTIRQNGELKAIYEKWGILDQHQQRIGIL